MINTAVIGTGYWGPNIVRNLSTHEDFVLIKICDLSSDRLKVLASHYPSVSTTRNYQDIIKDPHIDLVAVVTPVKTHFEIGKAVLNAGKHLLLAKPMATTADECLELVELAQKKKCILMVDHTFVYHPAVQHIQQMLQRSELGELLYYHSSRMNLGLYQPDVSVIFDLMPHDLSILTEWIPQDPVEISVTSKHAARLPQPDIAAIQLNYPNNFIASIHVSWLSPSKIRETILTGRKKMVLYDDTDVVQKVKVYDKGVDSLDPTHKEDAYTKFIQYRQGDILAPALPQTEALKIEIDHLADCIHNNLTPRTDGIQGLRVVRILEQADKLARQQKCWVPLQNLRLPKEESIAPLKTPRPLAA